MMKRAVCAIGLGALLGLTVAGTAISAEVLKMSTTTSTQSSGLLDLLLPEFQKDTGIEIKVVAKGTGAAIRDGMDGNVDVIFVHALEREEQFVAEGYGTKRYPVMYNDFVLIGPANDPAGVKATTDAAAAFKAIATAAQPFVSRGDDSGTHTKEQEIWRITGLPLEKKSQKIVVSDQEKEISSEFPADSAAWYLSIGQGMGKTITFAEEKQGYTLSDRGTYIKYRFGKTPPVDLEIVSEGDKVLANPYGIIPVNPEKHPHVQIDLATKWVEWLISEKGQQMIADYTLEGQQLF
ncbi:MAG TPA: extracellular solute-binding protein, partial [Desulforhopalus sp.]|nr:extracellular solute-binding protein [Desulforhopalus sp.]